MTSFARVIAGLLALAIGACAFLPWTPGGTALEIPLRSLLGPGTGSGAVSWALSLALPVVVSAGIVLVGAVGNSRTLVIIGGLAAVAIPTAWILVNAISSSDSAVAIRQIQIGAYGAAIAGFMVLILAAVAVDTRVPSVR